VIRAHFDGGVPSSVDLRADPLGSGKQALLFGVTAVDPNTIALLIDAEGSACSAPRRRDSL